MSPTQNLDEPRSANRKSLVKDPRGSDGENQDDRHAGRQDHHDRTGWPLRKRRDDWRRVGWSVQGDLLHEEIEVSHKKPSHKLDGCRCIPSTGSRISPSSIQGISLSLRAGLCCHVPRRILKYDG